MLKNTSKFTFDGNFFNNEGCRTILLPCNISCLIRRAFCPWSQTEVCHLTGSTKSRASPSWRFNVSVRHLSEEGVQILFIPINKINLRLLCTFYIQIQSGCIVKMHSFFWHERSKDQMYNDKYDGPRVVWFSECAWFL